MAKQISLAPKGEANLKQEETELFRLTRFFHGNDEAFRQHGPGAFRWRRVKHGDETVQTLEMILPYEGGSFDPMMLAVRKGQDAEPLPDGTVCWAWNGSEDEPILRPSVDASAGGGPHGFINGKTFNTKPIPATGITEQMLGIERHPNVRRAEERAKDKETQDTVGNVLFPDLPEAAALVDTLTANAADDALVALGIEQIRMGVIVAQRGLRE